ncbi:hypothetical protein GGR50DRAFT_695688 [Xylaria sp. CBS 124048]|nr:hypothetical protein GGR50DRAFT_695688 [Xylaria sp. CBS 124048]
MPGLAKDTDPDDGLAIDGRPGSKEMTFWHYKNVNFIALPIGTRKADVSQNPLRLTDGKAQQLMVLKHIRRAGIDVLAGLSIQRRKQQRASGKSKGPFDVCASFGGTFLGGACNCCQYSSLASHCSLYGQSDTSYETLDIEPPEFKCPMITEEILGAMPIQMLETRRDLYNTEIWRPT